jgi:uncharacterized protein (DUF1800 family)
MALQSERDKVAHLLRRFGLGATEAEIEYYGAGGPTAALGKLLEYDKVEEPYDKLDVYALANPQNGGINIRSAQVFWYTRILVTVRPLEERLTMFWHDHFATSASKVAAPPIMDQHISTIRAHAGGKFPELLEAVSKDPAMIFWLDNQENVVGKPNENFAREVMELFTLGIGHYTEKDIQEAARAFTGWTIRRTPPTPDQKTPGRTQIYAFNARAHDNGEKSVFGETGNFGGEDVLGMLCRNKQTARYITEKMWKWFAYPDPEAKIIDRMTDAFITSGLDIRALVRAIASSPEFYSDKAERAIIKNPVDFCTMTMRAMGYGKTALAQALDETEATKGPRRFLLGGVAAQSTKSMGMELMFPPDVSGWEGGTGWITTATMVERMKWSDRIFPLAGPNGQVLGIGLMDLFSADPSAAGVAKRLVSLFDCPALLAKLPALTEAAQRASGGTVNARNVRPTANAVARLIFGSPEFQFL